MNSQSATEILSQFSHRTTAKRVALLELLMESPKAFTLLAIEKKISIPIDRVTIYRTLHLFELIGVVLKAVDHKGTCQYMYKSDNQNDLSMNPHLHCKKCGKVVCLPCLPKEYLDKLEKYEIEEMYFLMEGICPECLTHKTQVK
jgi:Fur family ferric uptake transcriptional regulator